MFCSALLCFYSWGKGRKVLKRKNKTRLQKGASVSFPRLWELWFQGHRGGCTAADSRGAQRPDHSHGGNTSPNRINEGAPERCLGEHRAQSTLAGWSGQNRLSSDAAIMNERKLQTAQTFGGESLFVSAAAFRPLSRIGSQCKRNILLVFLSRRLMR